MSALRNALFATAFALLAACGKGEATSAPVAVLTEPQVRAFVDKVEAATYSGDDVATVESTFADDVKITWRTPGEETVEWDKDRYLGEVVEAEAEVDVEYSYKIGAVKVAADGKSATVDVYAKETFDYDGSRYEEASDQVYRVELRDGQPVIVALEADSTSLKIDGEEQF
jgi:hypothetical protein